MKIDGKIDAYSMCIDYKSYFEYRNLVSASTCASTSTSSSISSAAVSAAAQAALLQGRNPPSFTRPGVLANS